MSTYWVEMYGTNRLSPFQLLIAAELGFHDLIRRHGKVEDSTGCRISAYEEFTRHQYAPLIIF